MRILLGTAVTLPAQRHLLGRRSPPSTGSPTGVVLGVSCRWNVEELRDHGVAYRERRGRARRMLLAQSLLARRRRRLRGRPRQAAPSWSWPKPVQRPRVRTLVGGGAGPRLFADIAEWADGWIPFGGAGKLKAQLPVLRDAMAAAGRDPAELHVVPMGVLPPAEKLEFFASLGVTETVLQLPVGDRDECSPCSTPTPPTS